MPTMELNIQQPDLEKYVAEQVEAGHFSTPEAVVEDALKRVMNAEILTEEDLLEIEEAEKEIDRGEFLTMEQVRAHFSQKYGIN
jgi:hypothetical protein